MPTFWTVVSMFARDARLVTPNAIFSSMFRPKLGSIERAFIAALPFLRLSVQTDAQTAVDEAQPGFEGDGIGAKNEP
jgi:hypothetical protein